MTPALDLLKKVRAEHRVHSYEHDPKAASYGLEVELAPAVLAEHTQAKFAEVGRA